MNFIRPSRVSKTNLPCPPTDQHLDVESLEPRMMLSAVSVAIAGDTGDEMFSVWINDALVAIESASTSQQVFSYETDQDVNKVRIQFQNDFYDPANNYDRNLTVDNVTIDGIVFEAEDPSVFGTGTWTGSAITPGFNQSEFINANGYLDFLTDQNNSIDFAEYNWNRSADTSSNEAFVEDVLLSVRGGTDAASSIWADVEIQANQLYEFSVDAWREVLAGSVNFDGQPWVTAGVDIFDSSGALVSKEEVQLFGPTDPDANTLRTREFFTPENAASASLWVWAQETEANIPVRISDIGLRELVNNDQTPPQLDFAKPPITEPTNEIRLVVNATDPVGIQAVFDGGFELTITGPNGFDVSLNSIAGTGIENGISYFYSLPGDFNTSSNGEYFVTANAGQFQDGVGNSNPETLLGSFLVNIPTQG